MNNNDAYYMYMAASRPQDIVRLFFLAGFFRVSLDGLSERGSTRGLFTVEKSDFE